MKRFTTILCTTFVALSAGATPFDMSGYDLVWSDEFYGTEIDRTVWNIEENGSGCGNHELQHYIDSPATVSVHHGMLHLTAVPGADCGCGKHDFVSGRINTLDKKTFQYGIIQASIRLPETTNGLWPAFWMMGNDITSVGWPACGETDILEMGHADGINATTQDRLFNGALHWGQGEHHQAVGAKTNHYSLQDGKFHTYTLVWDANTIEMYVDDQSEPYLSHNIADQDDIKGAGRYFNKPGFILFNLAVGGDFPGIHDKEGISALADGPRSMDIDYVRVYQKTETK